MWDSKDRIKMLERKIKHLETQLDESLKKEKRYERQLLFAGRSRRNKIPDWIKDNLKFLIFACHPDRNGGKAESVEVTKQLLKLK